MFSKKILTSTENKGRVGTVLDTNISKKMFHTYVSQDVLENEIYNHSRSYVEVPHDADLTFAQNFIDKDGKFIYCTNLDEMRQKINQFFTINHINCAFLWEDEILPLLKLDSGEMAYKIERMLGSAKVAITQCESLVADEGSIIINPNQNRFRALEGFPEYHIILASKNQIKLNIEHAVSDYILKHPEIFPFIIDLSKEEKKARFAINKPILSSTGTKKIIIFYCEECSF